MTPETVQAIRNFKYKNVFINQTAVEALPQLDIFIHIKSICLPELAQQLFCKKKKKKKSYRSLFKQTPQVLF